ncbi:hypothetical protein K1719_032702 [Acacia pycnantha]|nr:hypothetical protein K1719_032702 [Acacia pycnantha]
MEELNTNASKVATNDRSELSNINPGKENMSQMVGATKQGQQGVKLQSTIMRNLKVRRKKAGVKISKDAAELEAWRSPVMGGQASSGRSIDCLRDWRVTVSHVYREGNRCADFLATYALSLEVGIHSLEEPPDGLRGLLHDDAVGAGSLRLCCDTH